VIVPEPDYTKLVDRLPAGCEIVGRARPLFQKHDYLLIGAPKADDRTANAGSLTR
jgi:hypothetical protein